MGRVIPSTLTRTGGIPIGDASYSELISAVRILTERNHNHLAMCCVSLTKRMKTYGVRKPKYLPYHIIDKIAQKGQ